MTEPLTRGPGRASDARTGLGRNLTYGLLDSIGRAIVIGSYQDKRFPTEAELAQQHAVSRSVTREAVKMLTAKGLLSARPRQGTIVQPASSWNLFDPDILRWLMERKFSLGLLRHFSELRLAVEPAACALAARGADADSRARIAQGFERMVAAEKHADDPLEADIAFHVAILRASENPFFRQFEDVVQTALRTSIRFTNRFAGRSASLPAHRAVLDAILGSEPDAAHAAMHVIIADVMALIEGAEAKDGAEEASAS